MKPNKKKSISHKLLDQRIVWSPDWDILVRANMMNEVRNYAHRMMNVPGFHKKCKGAGVTVGVLDSGVPQHEDLVVNEAWTVFKRYSNDILGHGTHVGGIIAAVENGKGVVGIAPEATMNYYTVLDAEGGGSIRGIIMGIEQAIRDDCDVLNMSLGIAAGYQNIKELEDACKACRDKGIIIFAAAGNEYGPIGQPACYDSVLCVGAVNWRGKKADFSNFGREIDFAAGGVEIFSTFPDEYYDGQKGYINRSYCKLSGTCLTADTVVLTDTGYPVPIKDIEPGDDIQLFDPDERKFKIGKVAKRISNGVKETVKIRTRNYTIKLTKDHMVLRAMAEPTEHRKGAGYRKDYGFEWIAAGDVEPGMYLVAPKDTSNVPVRVATTGTHENQAEGCPDMTVDEAQLLGFMIGDRWVSGKQHNIGEWMLEHGLDKRANEKSIPKEVFELSNEARKAFVVGLLHANGTTPDKTDLSRDKKLTFSSSSIELSTNLKYLLLTLGIRTSNVLSRVRRLKSPSTGRYITTEEHSIAICKSEAVKLFPQMAKFVRRSHDGYSGLVKKKDYPFGGAAVVRVTQVEDGLAEPVYDITMENEDLPLFVANGLSVHNSMATPVLAGVYALLLAYERKRRSDPGFRWSLKEATRELRKIAFDVGPKGWDNFYGHGIPVLTNRLTKRHRRRRLRHWARKLRRAVFRRRSPRGRV